MTPNLPRFRVREFQKNTYDDWPAWAVDQRLDDGSWLWLPSLENTDSSRWHTPFERLKKVCASIMEHANCDALLLTLDGVYVLCSSLAPKKETP